MKERAIAKINLTTIVDNIKLIKKSTGKALIMLVVKANAYGHGLYKVAKATQYFVDYFGVAIIQEGLLLRTKGIKKPIHILGNIIYSEFSKAYKNHIDITIFSAQKAEEVKEYYNKTGNKLGVHIAIDTGMARIGFREKDIEIINQIASNHYCITKGIFTHYSNSDEQEDNFSKEQTARFEEILGQCKLPSNILLHSCNSAGIFNKNCTIYDMVRVGIMAYGLSPNNNFEGFARVNPAMSITTQIIHMFSVLKGESVGYSRQFVAERPTKIATIPIGYADGLDRRWSGCDVIINGNLAPIIGRVCMDQAMVDITDIPNAQVADEVTIIGKQGDKIITLENIAQKIGTINYELATNFDKRIKQIHIE